MTQGWGWGKQKLVNRKSKIQPLSSHTQVSDCFYVSGPTQPRSQPGEHRVAMLGSLR